MNLTYERLRRPRYVFAGGQRFPSAYQGLRAVGPYKPNTCPAKPRILFVYPLEYKDVARELYFSLKNGIGPFRGTQSLLKFDIEAANVTRLDDFDVAGLTDHEAADRYRIVVEDYISTNAQNIDLAIILHRETERFDQVNPYLTSKFPLLKANIPTQVVTLDLLARKDTFQWSAANIALAMFAKMGGQPWAVETGLSDDTLIVGVNRANVRSLDSKQYARVYGFASTFSHDGIYLGTRLFPPATGWDAYLSGLERSLRDAIETWRSEMGTPVNLVLHVRKEIRRDEQAILERCLASTAEDLVKTYSILKVIDTDNMFVFNPSDAETCAPPPSIMVRLAGHRAILQIAGHDPAESVVGKKIVTQPWHINLLQQSPGAPPFRLLCNHIVALAAMNWRGLNAEATPISVQYPKLMADLLGRFQEAGFDVSDLSESPIMNRPWFL